MDGRSAVKSFKNAKGAFEEEWVKLDFEKLTAAGNFQFRYFGESHGFNLIQALEKHPIAELKTEEQKQALLQSLKKGNLQVVTLGEGDAAVKRFIAADPEFKGIKVYDQRMKEITTDLRNSRQIEPLQKNQANTGKGLGV